MNKKLIWLLVAIAVIVAVFVSVAKKATDSKNKTIIKIGAVLPLTGIAAAHGENERDGINLAIKEINAAGGINGKLLEVVLEDDQTDPKTTVTAVTKLINVDRVEVIIGATWDFLANAAIPVIDQNKKVLITPSALPDTLEVASPYLFNTHSPVAINESVFEKFLEQFTSGKIVIITPNIPWGKAHADTFKKAIEHTGNTLAKEIILPKFDNNDIQRELTLIRNLRPDAILTAINFSDTVSFAKKKQELGIKAKVLAEQKTEDMYTRDELSESNLRDFYVFRFSVPSQEFIQKYKAEYGKSPQEYADTAYDAVYAIKLAIENAGEYDAESIKNGLHKIAHFDGASGKIDFTTNNYPGNKLPVLEMFNGERFVEVD